METYRALNRDQRRLTLLVRPRGAGDVIMATATAREYSLRNSQRQLIFATEPEYLPLVETNPWVHQAVGGIPAHGWEVRKDLTHEEAWAERTHAIRLQCRHLGIQGPDLGTVGDVYPTIVERVRTFRRVDPLRPAVAVHLAGKKPTNTWPHGEALCRGLREMGLTPVQVGGTRDERIDSAEDFRGIGWRQTAALLQRVRFAVCTDSAMNHLAAATDTPAIVLFPGCGEPAVTGYATATNVLPARRDHTVLPRLRAAPGGYGGRSEDTLASLTPELVLEYCRLHRDASEPRSEVDVTVLLSAWNHAPYAAQSIDSILAQEGVTLELFAVDDGSTDGTDEVLAQYSRDSRVTVLSIPHQGIAHCRNRGLRMAAGRYICTFDSDDEMLPGCLARRVEVLEQRPERAWVICRMYRWLADQGRDVEDKDLPTSGWAKWRRTGRSFWDFRMGQVETNVEPGSASMFRREVLDRLGLFSNILYEDALRHLLLLRFYGSPAVLDVPLYRYRRHKDSILAKRQRMYGVRGPLGWSYYRRAYNLLTADADELPELAMPAPHMQEAEFVR